MTIVLGIENQLTANMLALFLLRRSGWFETDVVVSGENSFWSRLFYTRPRQRERKEAEAEEGPFSKGGFWASCDMARRDLRSIDDYATCTVVSGSCMELLSRRRWTTGLAQQSNNYGIMPCTCCINVWVKHKHNSFLHGPKQLSSPTTKELYCPCY